MYQTQMSDVSCIAVSYALADPSIRPTSVQYYVTKKRNELTASMLISLANFSGNGVLTAVGSADNAMVFPYTGLYCTEVIPLGSGVAEVGGPTTGGVRTPTLTELL